MNISRRKMLALVGGGAIVAATGFVGHAITQEPKTAMLPWKTAGAYNETRRRALSYALLAPNPHNRQPWKVDLSIDNEVIVFADTDRMLPHTDPFNRQIVIGLGCFLELLRMAAAEDGYKVNQILFPEGVDPAKVDERPIARLTFVHDPAVEPDPLFRYVLSRRTLKEPYDTSLSVKEEVVNELAQSVAQSSRFGGSINPSDIDYFRKLSREAMRIEIETPRTYQESVDLFRIGHKEVDANPDGIDFIGTKFEALHLTGQFSRELAVDRSSQAYKAGVQAIYLPIDTAMGHIWLTTETNSRSEQIKAGADWLRINLAATRLGLGIHPLSQALQEYPEMTKPYKMIHDRLVPDGGTVQMFARIGYGPEIGPSPRWGLETKVG